MEVTILEGMKIKKIGTNEIYTLVKSSVNGSLYGVYNKQVIKLNDENEGNYIVDDLSYLSKLENFLEIDRGDDTPLLIRENGHAFYEIKEAVEFCTHDSDEYTELEIKVVEMTVEEYYKKIDDYVYFFKLRENIHEFYKVELASWIN